MISTQLQLPKHAYHLANQYELGEPIRVYQVTPMKWRTLAFMILDIWFLMAIILLLQGGFHIDYIYTEVSPYQKSKAK